MIVRKTKYTALQKIICPNCGSENTSYYEPFGKNGRKTITNKSKIRCNCCFQIHRLDECKLVEVDRHHE